MNQVVKVNLNIVIGFGVNEYVIRNVWNADMDDEEFPFREGIEIHVDNDLRL